MLNTTNNLSRPCLCLVGACAAGFLAVAGCSPKSNAPTNRGLLFRSSGNPLQYVNVVDGQTTVTGYNGGGAPELSPGGLPGDWGVYTIPAHSGVNVIRYAGSAADGDDRCVMKAYSVNIPIDFGTKLSYWIFPQQDTGRYVGVDLHCTDGTTLSGTAAVDQNEASMDPSSGHGDAVMPRTWSQVECDAGKWLDGKTVDQVSVVFHHQGGGQYRGYIDDIVLTDGPILSRSSIVSSTAPSEPAWVTNAVIYGINTRQFSPAGTFKGIIPQLDRLHDLGATVLWLLPINPIGQEKAFGSPYCVRDFYGINPAYGSAADLHTLVDTAHNRGMKIILDMTLDHTSWDNALITQHPDWYRHDNGPKTNPSTISRTPMWSDVAQLDYSNADLRAYMIGMQEYWLKTFDVDGFRYDSAEMVPTEFWNASTAALKAVKPDILLLGEGHRPEAMMKAFDVDYSFTLYPEVQSVIEGHDQASQIASVLQYERFQFPRGSVHMRYWGDQDTDKPAKIFGSLGSEAAGVMMFTLDGIPLIYNGTEINDASPGSFIGGPVIDWSKGDSKAQGFYSRLTALRRSHPELVTGDFKWLESSDTSHLAAYLRTDGKSTMVIAINLSPKPILVSLPIKKGISLTEITSAVSASGQANAPVMFPTKLPVGQFGYRIFVFKGSPSDILDKGSMPAA